MKIDDHILVRYFSGECSENEKTAIREWLESSEAHKRQFINERIRFDASLMIDDRHISQLPAVATGKIVWSVLKIASAVLILVGSSYLFSLYHAGHTNIITQNIHVPPGNRTSLTLPDGTFVWLNSNTTLSYPGLFSGKERIVELDGEAYFEVAKNKEKPFIVKTGRYHVEVLGTSFNIESYADKPAFSIALFTGKVKLYKEQGESLFLNQGETAWLADDQLQISPVGSEIYRWKDGLIVIEDRSFEEVMQLLEKYFGYEVIIQNDQVKHLGYHGKLRISDGVDHALRVLQNDFRFTYERDEDTNRIYIY